MGAIYRLVYTSFRKPSCDEEEIEKILESCKKKNPKRNITGVLLHSRRRFIQYIEGSREDLQGLYTLIEKDDRHTSVNKRCFEPIEERQFPSWEMGYKDIDKVSLNTVTSDATKEEINELICSELDFNDNAMRTLQLFFKTA